MLTGHFFYEISAQTHKKWDNPVDYPMLFIFIKNQFLSCESLTV
jgi:predicted membrane channel-forming protein YqfA (hemolysin III family)